MEKKKVLIVVHQLNFGGVQKSLITALDNIDYSANDVTLYVRKDRTDLLDSVNKNVKIIINKDCHNYYHSFISAFYSLLIMLFSFSSKSKKYFEDKQKDYIIKRQMLFEHHIYFNDVKFDTAVSYIQGYTAQFVAEYINADNKIVFFHGSEDELHSLHINIFHRFDKIIAVNSSCADLLKSFYSDFSNKISYLDNFVDADFIRHQANSFPIISNSPFVLCTCGRIAEVKGFDIAVEAAKLLKEKGIDFLWYFVGDGPELNNIKALISKYSLNENIITVGMQSNPYPYINACDIYVQSSRAEAMPLTIIEAQILNKPVVTTKTVGGMNIVKDNITGIQTEINAGSLADGIIKAMNPELLRSMREQLSLIDYTKEKERYKRQWAELLNG